MTPRRGWVSVVAAGAVAMTLAGCGLGGPAGPSSASPVGGGGGAASTSVGGGVGSTSLSAGGGSTSARVSTTGPSPAAIARTRRTHELPTPAAPQTVAGGWRTPVAAVTGFATTYVNWTAATVTARLRGLARASLGQARAAMTVEAREVVTDGELRSGGVANAGTVEAVAPVRGTPREYAVVTRERTTASRSDAYAGLAPAWHVALATVTRLPGGLWVLSGWQPEN